MGNIDQDERGSQNMSFFGGGVVNITLKRVITWEFRSFNHASVVMFKAWQYSIAYTSQTSYKHTSGRHVHNASTGPIVRTVAISTMAPDMKTTGGPLNARMWKKSLVWSAQMW